MGGRPQTIGTDWRILPAGLAAWILDHERAARVHARVYDGAILKVSRDDVLDDITLYWLTNSATSSARLYWENGRSVPFSRRRKNVRDLTPGRHECVPGRELSARETWARRAYRKLIYYNKLDKGGHFAAWEQPELFAAEIRAAFDRCVNRLEYERRARARCFPHPLQF